ncbi:MAG TPA: PaaI family thioesterase, partial [Thermoleophilia bacterium]|nr:PaaI family thioesterase [Thermoleophilia bacterium]
ADAAMGGAMASSLEEGETFSTVELQMNYFRPVRQGRLAASARMVRRGRTTAYLESEVFDADGQLVAKGSSCCVIRHAGGTEDTTLIPDYPGKPEAARAA